MPREIFMDEAGTWSKYKFEDMDGVHRYIKADEVDEFLDWIMDNYDDNGFEELYNRAKKLKGNE